MKKKLNLRKETVAVLGGRQLGSLLGGYSGDWCLSDNVECKPGKSDYCIPAPGSNGCYSSPCAETGNSFCETHDCSKNVCVLSIEGKGCIAQEISK